MDRLFLNSENEAIFSNIEYTLPYLRFYGEKKLRKPKELKGLKQDFSVDYIYKRCKCQVWVVEDDIWVKHNDYFSGTYQTDGGLPLSVRANSLGIANRGKKFVYDDNWGAIVNRNQAYICIKNIVCLAKSIKNYYKLSAAIIRKQEEYHGFETYSLEDTDMSRMWEEILKKFKSVDTTD